MSTVTCPPETEESRLTDEELHGLVNQNETVVNRLGAARGTVGGILIGAALWAGLILTGAALIR